MREVESAPPDGEAGPRAWQGAGGSENQRDAGCGERPGLAGSGEGWAAGQASAPIAATTEREAVPPVLAKAPGETHI